MKKIILILFLSSFIFQTFGQMPSSRESDSSMGVPVKNTYPIHEFGFSLGLFPIIGVTSGVIGFFLTGVSITPSVGDWNIGHTYHRQSDTNFEKMYHFGSYMLKYNSHFNPRNSIGMSFAWVGKHIDVYWHYPTGSIEGRGWAHYFTWQGNYRRTYYRKNNVSLFFGIHFGGSVYVISKELVPDQVIHSGLLSRISNERHFVAPAFHWTALGIEVGERNVFNIELGIGTQGFLQLGFKRRT